MAIRRVGRIQCRNERDRCLLSVIPLYPVGYVWGRCRYVLKYDHFANRLAPSPVSALPYVCTRWSVRAPSPRGAT